MQTLEILRKEIHLILHDKKQHNTYIQNAEMGKRILMVQEILIKHPMERSGKAGKPYDKNVARWCRLTLGMNKHKVRNCIKTYETASMLICGQPAKRRVRR